MTSLLNAFLPLIRFLLAPWIIVSVIERQNACLREMHNVIQMQLRPNGGVSLFDKVTATAEAIAVLNARFEERIRWAEALHTQHGARLAVLEQHNQEVIALLRASLEEKAERRGAL